MNIKGTAIKATKEFVKNKFPNQFEKWIEALPEGSKEFYTNAVFVSEWYPLIESLLDPTEVVAEMFFNNDISKAGFELGKDSALQALKGVYKIFIKMASVDYVLKRAKSIFSTYYSDGFFDIIESQENFKIFNITGFKKGEETILPRIAGWIEGIFSMVSNKSIKTNYDIIESEGNNLLFKIKVKFY